MMFTIQRFQTTNNRVLDITGPNKVLENTASKQSVSAAQLTGLSPSLAISPSTPRVLPSPLDYPKPNYGGNGYTNRPTMPTLTLGETETLPIGRPESNTRVSVPSTLYCNNSSTDANCTSSLTPFSTFKSHLICLYLSVSVPTAYALDLLPQANYYSREGAESGSTWDISTDPRGPGQLQY